MLLASFGTAGDLLPFIALGQALQRRGHAVQLRAPSVHAALVRDHGLACLPYGTDEAFRAALLQPALTNPRTAFAVLWPLLLPAAPLARVQRPGVPVVGAWLAPANRRSCHDPLAIGPLPIPPWVPMAWRRALWRHVDRRFIAGAVLPTWNAERTARGLPPLRHFLPHLQTVPDLSLMLFPDWFAPAVPGHRGRRPERGGLICRKPAAAATRCMRWRA